MNGELDFEDALLERVGLLKGLPVDTIDKVLAERITLDQVDAGYDKMRAGEQARSVIVFD